MRRPEAAPRYQLTRLVERFRAAGLRLCDAGPVAALSNHHKRRIAEENDLGMLGAPNHLD